MPSVFIINPATPELTNNRSRVTSLDSVCIRHGKTCTVDEPWVEQDLDDRFMPYCPCSNLEASGAAANAMAITDAITISTTNTTNAIEASTSNLTNTITTSTENVINTISGIPAPEPQVHGFEEGAC